MNAFFLSFAPTRRLSTFLLVLMLSLLQAACGGGGGAPTVGGSTSTGSGNGSIKLALTDANGVTKTETSSASPLTAKATVLDDSGKPVAGKIVTFSLSSTIATLTPLSGAVLTDANGVAQITLTAVPAGAGAAEITASVTVGKDPVTAKLGFTATTKTPVIKLELLDGSGLLATTVSVGKPLSAKATVLDEQGAPAKGRIVTFTVSSALATLFPTSGTALTDENGVAKVDLQSANAGAGAAEVTASVPFASTSYTAKQAFSIGSSSSTTSGTIRVTLYDGNGNPYSLTTSAAPLIVRAIVTDDSGAPIKDKVVGFTVSSSVATISPVSASALTNSSGAAQVSLLAAGSEGAGEVTASTTIGALVVSAKAGFAAAATPTGTPAGLDFVGMNPSTGSIAIAGNGGSGRSNNAILTYKVVDASNLGVANIPVSFSVPAGLTLSSTSGITDKNGLVTVTARAGSTVTTARVTATVVGSSISKLSDQITVTSGLPAQNAFSISFSKRYLEGMTVDGTQNTITVTLGDSTGGGVNDGTIVAFSNDSGVILGNGGATCQTLNSTCTVTWRSQNPRTTSGVATVNAYTSSGANTTATASGSFYVSGSFASVYGISASSTFGATTRTTTGGSIPLDFNSSCADQTQKIEIVDANGNPMPEGSTVTITGARNVTATVSPATVAYAGSLSTSASTRGTIHTVSVSVPNCSAGSAKLATSYFDVSVTAPSGANATTRVSLGTYPYNPALTPL